MQSTFLVSNHLSVIKDIKTWFRKTTTENTLRNCIMLQEHYKKSHQPYMIGVAKDFKSDNQERLQVSGRF